MMPRSLQVSLILALAACGVATTPSSGNPGSEQQAEPAAEADLSGRPFTVTEVARFDTPWAMDFLPGSGVPMTNRALVSERDGRLWIVDTATGEKQAVSGVPRVHVAGQGGLGDVVAHPDFAGNRRIYLSFVEQEGGISGAVLGYGRLVATSAATPGAPVGYSLEDFRIIWRQTPKVSGNGHFSHRIVFAPDGTIYLSSGDRQKMQPAQDRGGDLGKIIHITADGKRIDGPFLTMGHRNVLGLDFAPDGRLWATEMGPKGGDELNLVLPGRNYGWPQASYGSHYDGEAIPDDHAGRGFEEPKVWWNPSISPGGLLIYSGDLFPRWKGDALIPALSGQALIRVDIEGTNARKADQWDMGNRIRAVDQGPRGEVYLMEDGRNGSARMLRLEPARR